VFSEPALLPWRTVEKNLRLPLQLLGKSRDEQTATARDMMKMWEIGHVGGRYPLQLTPGNKMRAALARAMITKPKILLLDEPFAALDAITRNKVSAELMKVREKLPFATLHVTHSAAEAAYLAKRVVVLSANPGRIQEIIEIPQEHPRGLEWRESTDFQDAVSRIRAALNQAKEVKQ
ncbi:MAG: ABC transporter ATP-binding protein, partial [Puniceicoccales bacterium]